MSVEQSLFQVMLLCDRLWGLRKATEIRQINMLFVVVTLSGSTTGPQRRDGVWGLEVLYKHAARASVWRVVSAKYTSFFNNNVHVVQTQGFFELMKCCSSGLV